MKENKLDTKIQEKEGSGFQIKPDSAFPFYWIIIENKNIDPMKQKVIGVGNMEGIVCEKKELLDWVSFQFNTEAQSKKVKATSIGQVEFLKKAVEEGIDVLNELSEKNNKLAQEIENWKRGLLKL